MRYHYEKPIIYLSKYGELYTCDHPVYDRRTLYKTGDRGLAVIQQRFDPETKSTYWTELDPRIIDELYLHPRFKEYFNERAETCSDGLYPTVTIRQIRWSLRLKPLKREWWESVFDRRYI